jgi:hypothetical protein
MFVVVLDELDQHRLQVTPSKDEDSIEALQAKGADDPFADSVRPRCSNRGLEGPDAFRSEDLVERRREL